MQPTSEKNISPIQEATPVVPLAKEKRGPVVNMTHLDPDNPIPLDFGVNAFTIISGQKYLPFGEYDNYPNLMWKARGNSVTQNACTSSIAKTCVGKGVYVINAEETSIDKDFLAFISKLNNTESLNDLVETGIDCIETDGNAWPEIVKGSVGGTKYLKVYMHPSLICRFAPIPKDKDKPYEVVKSIRLAEHRNEILRGRSLKAATIPLYSDNPLDKETAWRSLNGDEHTMLHLKNNYKGSLFYGRQRSMAGFRYQILEGKAAQANIDDFENGMVLSGAIIFKSSMTQAEAKAAGQEIIKTHTGSGKRGRIAVISSESGIEDFEFQPFDTQKEGSYKELDDKVEDKIITANNWDAVFFGMGDAATLGKGSGYVRAVYDVKKTTVIDPLCKYWMDHFVKVIIAIAADHFDKPEWLKYELAFQTAMPFSYSSDIDVNAVLTKNEGREIIGQPKSENPEWNKEAIKTSGSANQKPKENVPTEPTE